MLERQVVRRFPAAGAIALALLAAGAACGTLEEPTQLPVGQLDCAPTDRDGCSTCETSEGPLAVCERPGAGKADAGGCIGDVNGDGKVSFADLKAIFGTWGKKRGDAGYVAARDLDGDGVVGHKDFTAALGNLGCTSAPPAEPRTEPSSPEPSSSEPSSPEPSSPEPSSPEPNATLPATRPAAWTDFENATLALINERRAAGATCGTTWYPAVGPLALQEQIRTAAREHSADMAAQGYFSHTNLEGAGPMERMIAAGFAGMAYGENIAAGQPTPAAAVAAWMGSPGHCVNIMSPLFTLSGVGYVAAPSSVYRHFWTQNFGG